MTTRMSTDRLRRSTRPSHAPILAALAVFLAIVACGGGNGAAGTEPPTPAPTAAAPAATPAAGTGCDNPYVPVVDGATFERRTTSVLGESTQTATIKNVHTDGFSVERTGVLSGGRAYTYLENWSCTPEGLVQAPSDDLAAIATGANGTVTVETVSNDGVTLPKDIQAGDTWSEKFTVNVVGPDATTPWDVAYEFQAIGTEDVSVPAGTFTALHLTNHMTWLSGAVPAMDLDYWFAQGVGLVKSSYSMEGLGSGTTELVSYTIP